MSTNSGIALRQGDTYTTIYCHWDGYPSGVGQDLLDDFNSYDAALKLILEGDHSTPYESYAGRGEDWESNRPNQRMHARREQDYLYVFKNGVWKIPVNDQVIDIEYIDDEGYCSLKDYFEFRY